MWPFRSSCKFEKLSAEEIRKHNNSRSLWIIAGNSVYDLTEILAIHPGGTAAIAACGGGRKDCEVDLFFHSPGGRDMWNKQKIGEISDDEKRKLLSMPSQEYEKNSSVACQAFSEPAAKEISAESAFLNSPDWVVYNKRKITPPCCCRPSVSQ